MNSSLDHTSTLNTSHPSPDRLVLGARVFGPMSLHLGLAFSPTVRTAPSRVSVCCLTSSHWVYLSPQSMDHLDPQPQDPGMGPTYAR